jgi:hypothetical protein
MPPFKLSMPYTTSDLFAKGWNIINNFAVTDMTLPHAKNQLENLLSTYYSDSDWHSALNGVLAAENNSIKALKAINKLSKAATAQSPTGLTPDPTPYPKQLHNLKNNLTNAVAELKSCK